MVENANLPAPVSLMRAPLPRLRPFVKSVWLVRHAAEKAAEREHVLPTGGMHLVFRLSGGSIRVFGTGAAPEVCSDAVIGGARSSFYVKDSPGPAVSIGVQLLPGGATALFGESASAFAERHVPLVDVWGRSAPDIRERLLEAGEPERQLDLLQAILSARLPEIRALHPAVASALAQFGARTSVSEVVRQSGYSHRGFVALFRRFVGLTPKLYSRVLRFQCALAAAAGRPEVALVDLAMQAGYSDQAHFTREFREFAGMTPEAYRRAAPTAVHHVPAARSRG